MTNHFSLANFGWRPFFQQQLSLDEWDTTTPARVAEQHKSELEVLTEEGRKTLPITHSTPQVAVGDWVLLDREQGHIIRVLERLSCFRRFAAGSKVSEQLIAANVDTAFIVCSLNDDFNLNRIERYLSIANDAGAEPVIILSKMDLCDDPNSLRSQVQSLDSLLCVETINGLDSDSIRIVMHWCEPGKTVVMLGSSGAGKSTLSNTLLGENLQTTNGIREDDSKGRHTTTRRSLLSTPNGTLILDTPGMRELQLGDCEHGVSTTFADIEELATQCRFSNCQHGNEPGCAVRAAIEEDKLDGRRFTNYQKLLHEQALNGASLAQRRSDDRDLGKFYKRVLRESKAMKRG